MLALRVLIQTSCAYLKKDITAEKIQLNPAFCALSLLWQLLAIGNVLV